MFVTLPEKLSEDVPSPITVMAKAPVGLLVTSSIICSVGSGEGGWRAISFSSVQDCSYLVVTE